MILYNITISIDQVVEIQFVDWLKNKHIHDVLNTGCFKSARFSRLASHAHPDSTNYTIQYLAENQKALDEYKSLHATRLKEEGVKLFGDKMQAFRTEMEVIGDYYPNQS